ncbi:MAG: hypothetical protein ACUZ8N_11125 [Candidatus Scalindua sp.]
MSISDDLGSDFYCTLFKREKDNGHEYIIPNNSFAIQIKSNRNHIPVTGKIKYLKGLAIPFFVGVVSQKENMISVYSGEILPRFFSLIGVPEKLTIKLTEKNERHEINQGIKEHIIPFAKVLDIRGQSTNDELDIIVNQLSKLCSRIQENIVSKTSKEYVFTDFNHNRIDVIAGSDSIEHFESNFMKKLAAVYCNLNQLYESYNGQCDESFMKKYNVYKNLYYEMSSLGKLPGWLSDYFKALEQTVEK